SGWHQTDAVSTLVASRSEVELGYRLGELTDRRQARLAPADKDRILAPTDLGRRFAFVLSLAEASLDRVDLAEAPIVGIGDQGQEFVAIRRPKGERLHFCLVGPQVRDALNDGAEVIALDTMARTLVGVEEHIKQRTVEEAPAAVQRLGYQDW